MKYILFSLMLLSSYSTAGDDASGTIPYRMDLSGVFTVYEMGKADYKWSESLTENLKYKGEAVHFVKTSIPLYIKGVKVNGRIYQSTKNTDIFYVADGHYMFKLGERYPVSPVILSVHAPKSKNFFTCLKCKVYGVLVRSSSKIYKGKVEWLGDSSKQF